jgi:hypothetical protein
MDENRFAFSDELVNQWPAAVITNPTDARFYTTKQSLDTMIRTSSIRVLVFDPNPITNAIVSIDGIFIGNLTDQGNHLWSVSWDPQEFAQGKHTLSVVLESASGRTVRYQSFNLADFTPEPIYTLGPIVLGVPMTQGIYVIFIIFFIIILFELIGPFLFKKRMKILLEQYKTDKNFSSSGFHGFWNRIFWKPWTQALLLPPLTRWILLVILGLILIGPVFIAPLLGSNLGFVWIYKIRILNYTIWDLNMAFMGLIYLAGTGFLTYFAIRKVNNKLNLLGYLPWLCAVGCEGLMTYLIVGYFKISTLFLNPLWWLFGIAVIIVILPQKKK